MTDTSNDPPLKGWAWDRYTFAPLGRHCESCLGTDRVRWGTIPLVWSDYAGPHPQESNTRWVSVCDFCTWPDGGLLTKISIDGTVVIVRSSTHGTPRTVVCVPRTAWLQ